MFYGLGLFGKVHKSPKGYFIATQFAHICFIPIAPITTYIITSSRRGKFTGLKIPTYKFSRNLAYLRGLLLLGLLACVPRIAIEVDSDNAMATVLEHERILMNSGVVLSVVCLIALLLTYFHKRVRIAPPSIGLEMDAFVEHTLAPNQSMHSDGAASGPAGDFRS